jgi:hypothetical protein
MQLIHMLKLRRKLQAHTLGVMPGYVKHHTLLALSAIALLVVLYLTLDNVDVASERLTADMDDD